MKYLFSGQTPTTLDNSMFKARKRATTPSSCYVLGRVWWQNNGFAFLEHIGCIHEVGAISRATETESVWNGITYTNLPKLSGNKAVSIGVKGVNNKLEDWYSRVESRASGYMCDTVLLVLEQDFKHYVRCYGFKNAYISLYDTKQLGIDIEEDWGMNFALEHSGVRCIDIGDTVTMRDFTLDNIDNYTDKVYVKSTKGFYAEKVPGSDKTYSWFTHFN